MRVPTAIFAFVIGPLRVEVDPVSNEVVFTHLQKFSRTGFLITWPFCIHLWFFWRKQMYTVNDQTGITTWFPGTEQGIYMRTPGFRYDVELGMKLTRGYFGLHWD